MTTPSTPVSVTPDSPATSTVKAKIGQQDYALRVSKASEQDVLDAIGTVNTRFQAIQKAGKITNPERIAVMVALNLAVELSKSKSAPVPGFEFPNTDIATLRQHIGHILKK